ncbi:MAG: TIGR01244 family sulfur transferase [Burkholderiaceae bacterium]
MESKKITSDFSVSPQMSAADVAEAARQGIKTIICNRPDAEGGADQPVGSDIESAAQAHGIAFRSIPFTSGQQTLDDIAAFRQALQEMPAPVLAYCRTGTRSAQIWAMAQSTVSGNSVDDTISMAAAAGIDLSKLRPVLEKLAGQAG